MKRRTIKVNYRSPNRRAIAVLAATDIWREVMRAILIAAIALMLSAGPAVV